MTFDRLHHVAIIVSSREKAKEFYGEKLGLPILRESFRPDKGDWKLDLRLGDGELEIFAVPSAPARPSYPEALGLRHLAFRVDEIRGGGGGRVPGPAKGHRLRAGAAWTPVPAGP